ncbi:WGR domain-containing protein [Shinella sp. HZN7]|uniref:WGR domain-containing protein n=1 Tax=Shinella sp. (strain HZN7) TaxID=879274 RepID=UPI0011AB66A1
MSTLPSLPAYRFRRIDAMRNMARFYMLSLEPTLFGEVAVLRHWGRSALAAGRR